MTEQLESMLTDFCAADDSDTTFLGLCMSDLDENTGGPMPYDTWDPIGLMEGKSEEQLLHWRAVELKHGRVSMLACLGWFHVAAGWHFIGDFASGYRVSDNPLI